MPDVIQVTVGLDEVGRGALAGPLYVGAVSLDMTDALFLNDLLHAVNLGELKDSKQLKAKIRELIVNYAEDKIIWGIGEATAAEIDDAGLSAALKLASGRALEALKTKGYWPKNILADAGLYHPFEDVIPIERFVKGDETYPEIALASIFAKVARDAYMRKISSTYPDYGFERNVGYGTREHREAIIKAGLTVEHRKLFVRKLLQ